MKSVEPLGAVPAERDARYIGKRISQLAAIGTLIGHSIASVPFEVHEAEVEQPVTKVAEQECEPIDDELLDETIPELFNESYAWHEQQDTIYADDHIRRMAVGEDLGLTMHNIYPEFDDLYDDLYRDVEHAIDVDEYYQRTEEFLALYDVELTFNEEGVEVTSNVTESGIVEPYSLDDMRDDSQWYMRANLLGLAAAFSDMPVEMVEEMNIKEVRLTGNGSSFHNSSLPGVIFLNAKSTPADGYAYANGFPFVQTVVIHEAAHAWHVDLCGPQGYRRDQQFAARNPNGLEFYQDDDSDSLSSDYNSMQTVLDEIPAGTRLEISDEYRDSLSDSTITFTEYGSSKVQEDFATTVVPLLRGVTHTSLHLVPSETVDYKIDLTLARFYEADPRLAEYLIRSDINQVER